MSLTQDDLLAIKGIVDGAIDNRVPGIVQGIVDERVPGIVQGIIDQRVPGIVRDVVEVVEDKIEESQRQTANAFVEVHTKLNNLQSDLDDLKQTVDRTEDKVDRVALQQRVMAEQLDNHAMRLTRAERKLKLRMA